MMSPAILSMRKANNEVGEDANKGSAGNGMVKYSWVCSFVVGFLITLWT